MTSRDAAALAQFVVILPLIGIWVYALVDFSRTDERDLRTFDRRTWIVMLVLFNVIGGLMWLRLGRPGRTSPRR